MEYLPEGAVIVLAAHGAPALDYPGMRVALLMLLERICGPLFRRWQERLDAEIRRWPRTPKNDPYKLAAENLAQSISQRLGCQVLVGYNEFCMPPLDEAIEEAASIKGVNQVLVVPTMLLRGNQHTEEEIRQCVEAARQRHLSMHIHYAWPFDDQDVAALFASHLLHQAAENYYLNPG